MVLSAISNIFKPHPMTTHSGVGPTAGVIGFTLSVHAVALAVFKSASTAFIKAELAFGAALIAGALLESAGMIILTTLVGVAVLSTIP